MSFSSWFSSIRDSTSFSRQTKNASARGLENIRPGVVTGRDTLRALEDHLYRKKQESGRGDFRIPAVYCRSPIECQQVLEQAQRENDRPEVDTPLLVIRINFGTAVKFAAAATLSIDTEDEEELAVQGAIAAAQYIRRVAHTYGVAVILQSESMCISRLTGWFESGVLPRSEAYFQKEGEPLFSSHILSLPETECGGSRDEVLAIGVLYKERLELIDTKLNIDPDPRPALDNNPLRTNCSPQTVLSKRRGPLHAPPLSLDNVSAPVSNASFSDSE